MEDFPAIHRSETERLHDLVGSAIDPRVARVRVQAGDRILEDVAVPAMQLQALVDHASAFSVQNNFALAASDTVRSPRVVEFESAVGHQIDGIHIRRTLGQDELRILEQGDRLAEDLPFRGVDSPRDRALRRSRRKLRVVEKDGHPGDLDLYSEVIGINLIGSFNVLRLAAARMVKNEAVDGERGVVIMTASVAAYEGQIGQAPYASSKAGIVGLTLVAARDVARKTRPRRDHRARHLRDPDPRWTVGRGLGQPGRPGSTPRETPRPLGVREGWRWAIVDNAMINGETIRLDGAIRMGPV